MHRLVGVTLTLALVGGVAACSDGARSDRALVGAPAKTSAPATTKARSADDKSRATIGLPQAKATYATIQAAYNDASRDLAVATDDTDGPTLHAAVVKAGEGFDRWIAQLRATAWPTEVQPFVDAYLALAASTGRERFAQARRARSMADLRTRLGTRPAFELDHAVALMGGALGVTS